VDLGLRDEEMPALFGAVAVVIHAVKRAALKALAILTAVCTVDMAKRLINSEAVGRRGLSEHGHGCR
jgi:hypothetical protein